MALAERVGGDSESNIGAVLVWLLAVVAGQLNFVDRLLLRSPTVWSGWWVQLIDATSSNLLYG